MKLAVLFRLLVRRSVLITTAALLLLIGALLAVSHTSLYAEEPSVRVYFRFVCLVFTVGWLLAFGGYLAKATAELEGVRLCRMVPGIRRQINTAILILVPLVGGLATAFIHLAMPDQFNLYDLPPIFLLALFIFSLGVGLGWSWLQLPVLVVFVVKLKWLYQQLDRNPAGYSALVLAACVALLHLRHRRFLVDAGSSGRGILSWFTAAFSIGVKPGRTGELPDRPGWSDPAPSVTLGKLIRAGALERLGQSMFGLAARTLGSAVLLYLLFAGLSYWAWTGQKQVTLAGFYGRIFLNPQPDPLADVMRVLFAIITGALAFICSLLLDTTLKPRIWHPLSRGLRGRAMFLSQLQQNTLFAGLHALAAFAILALLAWSTDHSLNARTLSVFLLPALYAYALMPIPQALFPDGVEVFRTKSDPKSQLLAGLTGGLFCLLVAYWTSYWPLKRIHADLSDGTRLVLLSLFTMAIYTGYYHLLKVRFATSDLRTRAG
jgi:hypothetical protein